MSSGSGNQPQKKVQFSPNPIVYTYTVWSDIQSDQCSSDYSDDQPKKLVEINTPIEGTYGSMACMTLLLVFLLCVLFYLIYKIFYCALTKEIEAQISEYVSTKITK